MAHPVARPASNFDFLAYHDPRLVVLGADAERLFAEFPVQCLSTLRTFGEILAQRAAAKVGVWVDAQSAQVDVLSRLAEKGALPYAPRELFHGLRVAGNRAAHEAKGDHHEALHQLRQARELAVWFQRSFGNNKKFDPGPFVPPKPPAGENSALADELSALRAEVEKSKVDLEAVRREVDEEAKKRLGVQALADKLAEEKALWEALPANADAALQAASAKHAAELAALQAAAVAATPQAQQATIEQVAQAGSLVSLDEAATRRLIDAQLRAAGWEADSEKLTESAGALPEKGRNRAIAEWRVGTGGDRADYVLFVGLEALGVVEAKRSRKDVSQALVQAERYSRTWKNKGEARPPEGGPWGKDKLAIPFLFASNGRPRLAQIAEKSGTWFRDARRDENHGRDLDLVAMATGTGKTRTCIGLIYRLLKARRFRRVLFLVDRSALGEQTANAFKDARLESLQTFADIFGMKELDDITARRGHQAAHRHHPGDGQAHPVPERRGRRAAGRPVRLHRRRRVPPRLPARPRDGRRRARLPRPRRLHLQVPPRARSLRRGEDRPHRHAGAAHPRSSAAGLPVQLPRGGDRRPPHRPRAALSRSSPPWRGRHPLEGRRTRWRSSTRRRRPSTQSPCPTRWSSRSTASTSG
jgi:type I restriction enzyme R subunit